MVNIVKPDRSESEILKNIKHKLYTRKRKKKARKGEFK